MTTVIGPLCSAMLAGASVLSLAAAIRERTDRRLARLLPIPAVASSGRPQPFGRRLLASVGRLDLIRRLSGEAMLRHRLILAGRPGHLDEFLGRKVALALGAVSLAVVAIGPSPAAIIGIPLALLAGFRGPDYVLARRARARQASLTSHVADLVEVLVATTDAGLSAPVALRRSVEVMRGSLADELDMVIREIDLGTPWREALARLLERTDSPPLRRLIAALTRSQRLGASVGASLRGLADDVRAERRAGAEETARRAPVKMLFPLVFLILPAFLLLTVGPAVLATLRSLH